MIQKAVPLLSFRSGESVTLEVLLGTHPMSLSLVRKEASSGSSEAVISLNRSKPVSGEVSPKGAEVKLHTKTQRLKA